MADDQSGDENRDPQTGNLGPNGSVSIGTVVQTYTQGVSSLNHYVHTSVKHSGCM